MARLHIPKQTQRHFSFSTLDTIKRQGFWSAVWLRPKRRSLNQQHNPEEGWAHVRLSVLESITVLRRLLFGRLTDTNHDLIRALSDLAIEISGRNHDAISKLLGDIENRTQAMRNIMAILDEYH